MSDVHEMRSVTNPARDGSDSLCFAACAIRSDHPLCTTSGRGHLGLIGGTTALGGTTDRRGGGAGDNPSERACSILSTSDLTPTTPGVDDRMTASLYQFMQSAIMVFMSNFQMADEFRFK